MASNIQISCNKFPFVSVLNISHFPKTTISNFVQTPHTDQNVQQALPIICRPFKPPFLSVLVVKRTRMKFLYMYPIKNASHTSKRSHSVTVADGTPLIVLASENCGVEVIWR